MNVPVWLWLVTIAGMIVVLVADLAIVDHPWSKGRRPREFGVRQAAWWACFYVGVAVLFGLGIWYFGGGEPAGEYFAGYLTEKSLSVDNLFVFYLVIGGFAVPRRSQHEVLLIGIAIALVMRGVFIAVGAQAVNAWSEVFYVFGAFLLYTAVKIVRDHVRGGPPKDYTNGRAVRWIRRIWPVTDDYEGTRLTVRRDGRRWATPLLLVIITIGVADLVFAIDSIPAIFGLTSDAYIVFTANAFALLGLRQLYFLLAGLMDRLTYISWGLSVIMAFIGAKMILHALHENGVHVPEINTIVSLCVIVGVMTVTVAASLLRSRGPRPVAAGEPGASADGDAARSSRRG